MNERYVYLKLGDLEMRFLNRKLDSLNGVPVVPEAPLNVTLEGHGPNAAQLLMEGMRQVSNQERWYSRYVGEIVHRANEHLGLCEEYRVVGLAAMDNNRCFIVPERDVADNGEYPPAKVTSSTCESLRHVPQIGEVWTTNAGNLALIVAGPPQWHDIDGAVPPGATYFPSVYPRVKTANGLAKLMIYWDRYDGITVAELQSRLNARTLFTLEDFWRGRKFDDNVDSAMP
jgi:hypothetical protein